MTVGLPGAGIGGIFYLLSALWMPFHAAGQLLLRAAGLVAGDDDRRDPPWNLIWRQFATALAIIASLWLTGWALAALLISHPTALGQMQTTEIGKRLPNVLRVGAVIVSVGTLTVVLAIVQIARLVVGAEARREARNKLAVVRIAALLLVIIAPNALGQSNSNAKAEVARHIATADRAFVDEDTATARREYQAALDADPFTSRALYRLGQLSRANRSQSQSYFRRYVAVEKGDAWGWIALGDALAADRKFADALDAYDHALALAPSERDVVIGRARVLASAGRTDAAIDAYQTWTTSHSGDAEAERELAIQQRRAGRYREAARTFSSANQAEPSEKAQRGSESARGFSAPAVEILSGGSRDSEANQMMRAGAEVSAQIGDRVRARVVADRRWLSGFSDVTIDDAMLGFVARPLAAFRMEASGGVARPHSTITVTDTIPAVVTVPGSGNGNGKGRNRGNGGTPPAGTIIQTESESADNIVIGSVRGVLRQPGGRSSLDLRLTRTLLDATPVLAINRVVRNEFAGRADIGILPRVKLRAGARAGSYSATGDNNTRISLLGGLAVAATNAVEVSGVFQRLTFDHATTSGYFAPEAAQLAELGAYAEFESDNGTVFALDAGAGAQRLQEFATAMGKWEPSYRMFASLDIPMKPGSAIHFELDSYDSRLGSDAPSTASSWRSVSFSAALRLALR
jgi:tetratricopeptide (TPR) repeat protein